MIRMIEQPPTRPAMVPVCCYCGAWRPHAESDQWRPGSAPTSVGLTHTHGACPPCVDQQIAASQNLLNKMKKQ